MYFTYILQHIYYATAPRSVIVLPARAAWLQFGHGVIGMAVYFT